MSSEQVGGFNNSRQPTGREGLSSRQKRRRQEAERNGPKRGPTRGLKYLRQREKEKNNPQVRPFANISKELRRVVGENAGRFICEVSGWVQEFCPLNSRSYCRMKASAKTRLYDKIKAKWDLPPLIEGHTRDYVVKSQCSRLYNGWRYRLKERHFTGYSKKQALENIPDGIGDETWAWLVEFWLSETQMRISVTNSRNRLKQTITGANGALSTARIFDDMVNAQPVAEIDPLESAENPEPQDPIYVRLYEKTKRHKDGRFDPDAEANFEKLKNLHATEVEKHGEDNIPLVEAYTQVLKERPGYVTGLGVGARPLKKGKSGGETSELRTQLTHEIQQLQDTQNVFAQREAELCTQIQTPKSSNEELKSSNELLKTSNEELKSSNAQLRSDVAQNEAAAIERKKKFREEIMQMLQTQKR